MMTENCVLLVSRYMYLVSLKKNLVVAAVACYILSGAQIRR